MKSAFVITSLLAKNANSQTHFPIQKVEKKRAKLKHRDISTYFQSNLIDLGMESMFLRSELDEEWRIMMAKL